MKRSPSIQLTAVLALTLVALLPAVVHSQGVGAGGGGTENRIEGSFKFLPIPYVNYDRSIGLQGGALPMAMFNPVKSDTVSPSSIAGGFGMYSTNKTWFLMAFSKLYLAQDDWRVTGAAGTGNVNFQFFVDVPVSAWIPYNTEMTFAFIQLQRRLYKKLYGGVSYVFLDFDTSLEALPDTSLQETLHGIGFDLGFDLRSSVYYPRKGSETTAEYFTYPSAFGNASTSSKLKLEHNHFFSARQNQDVVAGRLFAGVGLGDLSFNQQFIVGQGPDIRGYTQGEYRGNYMLAAHGEYRWNFHPRLGLVGFAAVATVFDAINENDNGKLLPGVGTGFRVTVDEETKMNVGLEIAVGLGDWGIYFRIGESF
jgi:outer membrane protein assembly factor BamA